MSNHGIPDLRVGDALSQTTVQAQYQACGPAGKKLTTLTVSYKAPKNERMVSLFLGTVPKDKPFDLDKMALRAGVFNTDHLINAMLRCGYGAPESAKVAKALCDMADEPDKVAP